MSKLGNVEAGNNPQPPTPLVRVGSGLPALPRKLVVKMLANEYIDFAELPPAKGKGRPVPQSLEDQIIVQAAELLQARKIIPDLATWIQCYSLYAATMATMFPARFPDLMHRRWKRGGSCPHKIEGVGALPPQSFTVLY